MKALLTAALALLTFGAAGQNFRTNVATDVPEGAMWQSPFLNANVIVVTMPDTPTVKQIGNLLLDHNHTVAATNTDLGTVTTNAEPFSKKRAFSKMIINARIKGRSVEFSARVEANTTLYVAGYGGGGGASAATVNCSFDQSSMMRRAFEHLDAVAHYAGGRIHYEKR